MKKHILLIISALVLTLNTFAQDAKTIMQNAVEKLKSYENIEFTIDYIMTNPEAGLYDHIGITGFTQGNAYKINTYGQDIICDGTTIWTYYEDANEINISDAEISENGYFVTLIDQYCGDFTAKFIDGNNGDIKKIEITPSVNNGYKSIIFTLNVKTLELQSMDLVNDGDTNFTYKITKFITNQQLPADFFIFKESDFPDAEIIDMR